MPVMALPKRIEGLAIVSTDGMIADANGVQPNALKLEADQNFFYATLDKADALVHGRHSGEGGPQAGRRRRVILTRRIAGVATDPENDRAVLWNPAGATLDDALTRLGLAGGMLAVIGGTEVFGVFLERGYDAFHLSRASHVKLPGGRPVFHGVPEKTPEQLLSSHGLKPDPVRVLDAQAGVSLVTWRREPNSFEGAENRWRD
jgi:dihydrofolate reductase